MDLLEGSNYMEALKKRSKDARVTRQFQFIGLEIATILHDLEHKALYIKLAKQYNPDTLLALAKDVRDRRDVKNYGAYFMSLVASLPKPTAK
jgi:hypothetical protein